jgi:hypothetical protein
MLGWGKIGCKHLDRGVHKAGDTHGGPGSISNFAMPVVKSLRARRESKRGLSVDSALALKSHQIVKIRLAGRVYDMAA